MKAFKWLPVVAAVSLALTGCGSSSKSGGGPGPTPPPQTTYTWQMIDLYKVERSKVGAGCAIFADVDGTTTNEVIASRVADRGFKILYHDQNGSVLSQHTIEGAQIPTNGRITINKSLLPAEGGYVSVEEQNTLNPSGKRDTYMFAIEKDLLADMTLVVRTEQASSNACYAGEQMQTYATNPNAAVTVFPEGGASPSAYHRSSSIDKRVNGNTLATDVPVVANVSSQNNILVTAFGSYSGLEAKDLGYYVMVPASKVYDTTAKPSELPTSQLKSEGLLQLGFTSTDLTVNAGSSLDVVSSNQIYTWQPIYESSTNFAYADGVAEFSKWAMRLVGVTANGAWNYEAGLPVSNNPVDVSLPNLSSFVGTSISACGTTGYCVGFNGYSSDDYSVQRTHVRTQNANNNLFYQTVFSKPASNQVLMESSSERLTPNGSEHIEIGLTKSSELSTNALYSVMEKTFDIQEVIKNNLVDYQDRNGYVSLPSARTTRDIQLMDTQIEYFSNKVN